MNLQIYEEASDWIVMHRNGGLDAQGKRDFDVWLRESPHHVRAYLEMSSVWEDIPSLAPNSSPSSEELIARAKGDETVVPLIVKESHPPSSAPPSVPRLKRGEAIADAHHRVALLSTLAASLLVACILLSWFYLQRGVYSTDVGERRSLMLTDGSSVELNSRSRIKIRYTEGERRIDLLEGQALFHVAKNKTRPFTVQAGDSVVRAVGTSFDVYKKSSDTIVTVVEGQVSVIPSERLVARFTDSPAPAAAEALPHRPSDRGQGGSGVGSGVTRSVAEGEVLLMAGEQLTVTPAVIVPPKRINVAAATAWTRRSLVFDSSPLTEVVEEFNRYNTRRLVIEDPQLANFLVSGVFSSVEPTLFLRFLRTQPELIVEDMETEVHITKRR